MKTTLTKGVTKVNLELTEREFLILTNVIGEVDYDTQLPLVNKELEGNEDRMPQNINGPVSREEFDTLMRAIYKSRFELIR